MLHLMSLTVILVMGVTLLQLWWSSLPSLQHLVQA
jgi:hypothetical protein